MYIVAESVGCRQMQTAIRRRLTQLVGGSPDAPAHTVPSPDGRWIARAILDPATDLLTWTIERGSSGTQRVPGGSNGSTTENPPPSAQSASSAFHPQFHPPDVVRDTFPSGIAWTPDGSGFFYDWPVPFSGGHGLYFHTIGTPQAEDVCLLYEPTQPDWYYQPHVSPDGRWLAVSVINRGAANRLTLIDLANRTDTPPYELIPRFMGRYDPIHWRGDGLILRAVEPDAPNGHLLALSLPDGARTVLLAEGDLPLLDALPLGDGWVASYLNRGCADLHWLDGNGALRETIPLPGLGTVDWLEPAQENAIRFAYTDFARPPSIYTWQPGTSACQPEEAESLLPHDPADFVTRAERIPSADGTPVPLFLAHRRDVPPTDRPVILTAYGGLGHNLTPRFSPQVLAWLEMGGIFVSVCARGGGEMGAAWHGAAVGVHKQRTFDDVLAVAQWLMEQGITTPQRLGLWGVSNGGLTAAACLVQAPERFAAVVIESGLLDMLDYPRLGRGRDWLTEYGNPDDPALREALTAYSPLHNLAPGQYPATLIATHERDPRVGEAHSLRFAQALTAAQTGPAPVILRVHPGSGHGDPLARGAWLAFFAEQLGIGGG